MLTWDYTRLDTDEEGSCTLHSEADWNIVDDDQRVVNPELVRLARDEERDSVILIGSSNVARGFARPEALHMDFARLPSVE